MLLLVFAQGAAANSNVQIVFSSTSSAGGMGPLTPFGFWIWCLASSNTGPYAGECKGTMYFYGTVLSPVEEDKSISPTAVAGPPAEIHVAATNGVFRCSLTGNIGSPVTVTVMCVGPRTGTDTMPASVVTVTPAS